ncbi:hypothetical protein JXA32_01905 [Candidatus Sumerlaeota bacterium]|nr:hypothetical protein [Candidatus Sumerlaeota bacterium]
MRVDKTLVLILFEISNKISFLMRVNKQFENPSGLLVCVKAGGLFSDFAMFISFSQLKLIMGDNELQ